MKHVSRATTWINKAGQELKACCWICRSCYITTLCVSQVFMKLTSRNNKTFQFVSLRDVFTEVILWWDIYFISSTPPDVYCVMCLLEIRAFFTIWKYSRTRMKAIPLAIRYLPICLPYQTQYAPEAHITITQSCNSVANRVHQLKLVLWLKVSMCVHYCR